MVLPSITTGDIELHFTQRPIHVYRDQRMASGGTVLGCYLSARLAANVACDIRNAVYDKSLELAASGALLAPDR